MKLATLRLGDRTAAVRIDEISATEIADFKDVGALLEDANWKQLAKDANGTTHALDSIAPKQWAPVVPRPGKIICVGLNYAQHIVEMGHEVPEFPTIFAKFADALIGPFDDLVLPKHAGEKVDWETELAIVIGKKASMVSESEAENFIAGYAIMNDVTMRDYQNRTAQWLQGKTFANSAPFGPYLVTADSFQFGGEISTQVSGKTVQSSTLNDQVFNPAELIAYISQILPLNPGDVIITGTPSGVGHGQKPPTYLASGQVLTSYIEGIGSLENHVV